MADEQPDRSDTQYKDLLCAITTGLFSQPGARIDMMGDTIVAAADSVFKAVKKAEKPEQGADDGSAGGNGEPPTAGPSDSSGAPKVPPDKEVPPEDTPMPGDTPKRPQPEDPKAPEQPKEPEPPSKEPPPPVNPPVTPPPSSSPSTPVAPPPVQGKAPKL